MLTIIPLMDLPEVCEGDDVGAFVAAALAEQAVPAAGDIAVVTSKIVSKAEGATVDLGQIEPSPEAVRLAGITHKDPRLVELVLRESSAIVRAAPNVLIARHRLGHVMANAGIDASNTGTADPDRMLLLPANPDASALAIADACELRCGVRPGVVIADSFGRPWRMGTVNVAIGLSGVPAMIDQRGEVDRDGRTLLVTQIALADALAAAAGLVMGEGAEGVPAALCQGVSLPASGRQSETLLRPVAEDLFR